MSAYGEVQDKRSQSTVRPVPVRAMSQEAPLAEGQKPSPVMPAWTRAKDERPSTAAWAKARKGERAKRTGERREIEFVGRVQARSLRRARAAVSRRARRRAEQQAEPIEGPIARMAAFWTRMVGEGARGS
jgi:hypothetical protein